MDHQPQMHSSAVTLMRKADELRGTDYTLVILETVLACTHPDFVMSIANAALLPAELRKLVADFLQHVILDGLSEEQRSFLFTWAQTGMLAGRQAPRA